MGDNLIVYRDVRYPTAFVDKQLPNDITSFLVQRGFRDVDADGLKSEMLELVEGKKEKTIVVFAQDIVPDTALDDISASALIRRYLDCGGSVVWFGDVPCFYTGYTGNNRVDAWKYGSTVAILGVIPFISCFSSERNLLTNNGKLRGLTTQWSGLRPIMPDKSIIALAKSKYLWAQPFIEYPWKKPWWKLWSPSIKIGVAPSVELKKEEPPIQIREWWYDVTLVNAWFKNYCPEKPYSGFLRLWDTNYLDRVMNCNELFEIIRRFEEGPYSPKWSDWLLK